jgi:hypothetical protein
VAPQPLPSFFEEVARALTGFLGDAYGTPQFRVSRRNIKVWLTEPAHEHYEAQLIRVESGWHALEVGFHSEHPKVGRNDTALEPLVAKEKSWRKALGRDPEAGPFLGRQGPVWRRVSEVWDDFDADDPDAALDVADRLDAYIRALEPLRAPP